MDKQHLKRILSINGASLSCADDEIRVLLQKARYSTAEVEIALCILRQEDTGQSAGTSEINRVFRSDTVLKPEEISQLLCIDIAPEKGTASGRTFYGEENIWHYCVMFVLALLLSLGGVAALMYSFEFGIFHTTSAMQFYDGS